MVDYLSVCGLSYKTRERRRRMGSGGGMCREYEWGVG